MGHAVLGVGLQPLACCDCVFKSRRVHRRLSVCYQAEVSASGLSLVQISPTECDVPGVKL